MSTDTPRAWFTHDKVLGTEWSKKRPPGPAALKSGSRTRGACPFCGHPTMDCIHHTTGGQPHG